MFFEEGIHPINPIKMSDQTKINIEHLEKDLAKTKEGSDEYWWVMGLIQDLQALNNYRAALDNGGGSEGDDRFHGIDDLEALAETAKQSEQVVFLIADKHQSKCEEYRELEEELGEKEEEVEGLEQTAAELNAEIEELNEEIEAMERRNTDLEEEVGLKKLNWEEYFKLKEENEKLKEEQNK